MMPITHFLEVIKKHGATGVLAVWLWYTHNEVQDVKLRLYACLDRQVEINNAPQKEKPLKPLKKEIAIIEDKNRKLAKKTV